MRTRAGHEAIAVPRISDSRAHQAVQRLVTVTTDLIGCVSAPIHGVGGTQLISGAITPRAARHAATAAAMAWIDAILSEGAAASARRSDVR
jgi:hypothetical protein